MRKGIVNVYLGSSTGVKTTPNKQWFGNYGYAAFGYGVVKRRDAGETVDRVIISSPGYLPWENANYCRTEYAGALYSYTGADL
jgi:hypothetical protein